jgi:hypothetical protein
VYLEQLIKQALFMKPVSALPEPASTKKYELAQQTLYDPVCPGPFENPLAGTFQLQKNKIWAQSTHPIPK